MRLAWLSLGWMALGAGIVGIALPLLPTTPFLILSAFAFSRGSPRLERWLLSHPRFGPMIVDWRREGAISRRAKLVAIVAMALMLIGSWIGLGFGRVVIIQAAVLSAVSIFLLTRPEPVAHRRVEDAEAGEV
ncbi:YbaN family protein [Consotaella aegiceratis]|uniref:YbaN family protein n=1 Tax=Consotaella aegiceratis TaxID=3097961 RepID=UPI002F3F8C3C